MCAAGIQYRNGNGVDNDLKEVFKLFLQSAIGGNKISMRYTAYMYFNGEGVKWWWRAYAVKPEYDFQKRDEIAAFYLGICHLRGLGTQRSRELADSYIEKSGWRGKDKLEEELQYLSETGKTGKALDFTP